MAMISSIRSSLRRASMSFDANHNYSAPPPSRGRMMSDYPSNQMPDQFLISYPPPKLPNGHPSRRMRRPSMIQIAKSAMSKRRHSNASTNHSIITDANGGLHIETPYTTAHVSVTRQLAFGTLDEGEEYGGWRGKKFFSQPCLVTFVALAIVATCIVGIFILRLKEDEIDRKLVDMWNSRYNTQMPTTTVNTDDLEILEGVTGKVNETSTNLNSTGTLFMNILNA